MKDSEFKRLLHPIGGGHHIASAGTAVSKGYKPDVTIRDGSGKLTFILESEQKTDRKAFLGDLLKAEVYAEQEQANPELIIVMQLFDNTTTQQIADHLRPYKHWLAQKNSGGLNLAGIQVLSDRDYLEAVTSNELLGSRAFKLRGNSV